MKLNGRDFVIYITDDTESVKERIAASMSSLPRWLIFEPDLILLDDRDYRVIDALHEVIDRSALQFPQITLPSGIAREDAEKLFVASNRLLTESARAIDPFLLAMGKGLKIRPDIAWADRREILNELRKAIDRNAAKAAETEIIAKEFNARPSIPYSSFELDHVRFSLNFGRIDESLIELFDDIKLTKLVPYATYSDSTRSFFKVYRDFRPTIDWLKMAGVGVVILKVDGTRSGKTAEYFTAAFTVTATSDLLATFDTKIGDKYWTKREFVDHVMTALSGRSRRIEWETERENISIAYFSFPRQCMNIAVFAELAMNDVNFYSIVAIDEFVRASKTKQNVYLHILRTNETVSLQQKFTARHNMFGLENVGEPYVRCRLKTTSVSRIRTIQELIGKLFNVYNFRFEEIVELYSKYYPAFRSTIDRCASKRPERSYPKSLRHIAPEIFVENYSRKCLYRPEIISDEEAADTNFTVMKFPTKGEAITRNYVCKIPTHPFPGLLDNQLKNKREFPFIPCCYSKNPSDRPGSFFRQYFFGESTDAGRGIRHVQTVYTTNKILPPGVIGLLPPLVREALESLEGNSTAKFIRIGVSRSPASAIEAILVAKGAFTAATSLATERDKLCTESMAMAARQELYDYEPKEIIDSLRSHDLRASWFVRVLELAYDCDIFVFSTEDGDENGTLKIPRHVKAYYKSIPTRETIFLFQHMGSESDHALYPQCELIARAIDIESEIGRTTSFSPTDPIVKGVFDIFSRTSRSYIFGKRIEPYKMRRFPIVSQVIDQYGKCRLVNIAHESTVVTVVTDPIAPFAAPETRNIYRTRTKREVDSFLAKWNLRAISQLTINGSVREIKTDIGVSASILVDSMDTFGLPIYEGPESLTETRSIVEIFSRNKRLAKIMMAYALHQFSVFLNDRVADELAYSKFAADSFEIDPGATFDVGDSRFRPNSDFLRNGKLIVTNDETVKRLMFSLRLFADTRPSDIQTFKDKIAIPGYIDSIGDFKDLPNQIILEGDQAVENLVSGFDAKYAIVDALIPGSTRSYFFETKVFPDKIFLVHPTKSISAANAVCETWISLGYNPDDVIERSDKLTGKSFDLYSYENDQSISKLIDGDSDDKTTVVFAYTVNGIPEYAALLPV